MSILKSLFYPLRLVVLAISYLLYFLQVLIFSIGMLILSLFISPDRALRLFHNGNHRALSFLIRKFLPTIRLLRVVSFENEEILQQPGPFIVVGNHRSWIDAPVIFSRLHGMIPVMKEVYTKTLFYRIFVSRFNFVKVDNLSLQSVKLAKEACVKLIDENAKILIYPEGSRSADRTMLPFKRMAFQLSKEHNVPLIPVIQSASQLCMTKGKVASYFPKSEVALRVKVLEPILPDENETSVQFAERVRSVIEKELTDLDAISVLNG